MFLREGRKVPKIKMPLHKRLEAMAEDLEVGGNANFKGMGVAVVLCDMNKSLTAEQRKDMERLLRRASGLLRDCNEFWRLYPELDQLLD